MAAVGATIRVALERSEQTEEPTSRRPLRSGSDRFQTLLATPCAVKLERNACPVSERYTRSRTASGRMVSYAAVEPNKAIHDFILRQGVMWHRHKLTDQQMIKRACRQWGDQPVSTGASRDKERGLERRAVGRPERGRSGSTLPAIKRFIYEWSSQ